MKDLAGSATMRLISRQNMMWHAHGGKQLRRCIAPQMTG
jgi:hypothetical protein